MNNIRVGIVDGLNVQKGTIRVTFPDLDDTVLDDIALLSFEQSFPSVGESVVCIFLSNGTEEGYCIGPYFNDENPPPIPDENKYVKQFKDGLVFEYDLKLKKLTISAENDITIHSDIATNGNLIVNGNLTVTGVISGTILG
ncbi:hypothetical protein [Psychrobacillus sp.]|uniref:hypothetical protein n=1 Tax=Psychrobacillus sp. TaxID=1871623 RepID=UPI0028BD935C|nr:hypothetical protein [Psychrobacillus sp.]